eukprot:716234-Rhodomonas_salina.1
MSFGCAASSAGVSAVLAPYWLSPDGLFESSLNETGLLEPLREREVQASSACDVSVERTEDLVNDALVLVNAQRWRDVDFADVLRQVGPVGLDESLGDVHSVKVKAVAGCKRNDSASCSAARHGSKALLVVSALLPVISLNHKQHLQLLQGVGGVVELDLVVESAAKDALALGKRGAMYLAEALAVPEAIHLCFLSAEPEGLEALVSQHSFQCLGSGFKQSMSASAIQSVLGSQNAAHTQLSWSSVKGPGTGASMQG